MYRKLALNCRPLTLPWYTLRPPPPPKRLPAHSRLFCARDKIRYICTDVAWIRCGKIYVVVSVLSSLSLLGWYCHHVCWGGGPVSCAQSSKPLFRCNLANLPSPPPVKISLLGLRGRERERIIFTPSSFLNSTKMNPPSLPYSLLAKAHAQRQIGNVTCWVEVSHVPPPSLIPPLNARRLRVSPAIRRRKKTRIRIQIRHEDIFNFYPSPFFVRQTLVVLGVLFFAPSHFLLLLLIQPVVMGQCRAF